MTWIVCIHPRLFVWGFLKFIALTSKAEWSHHSWSIVKWIEPAEVPNCHRQVHCVWTLLCWEVSGKAASALSGCAALALSWIPQFGQFNKILNIFRHQWNANIDIYIYIVCHWWYIIFIYLRLCSACFGQYLSARHGLQVFSRAAAADDQGLGGHANITWLQFGRALRTVSFHLLQHSSILVLLQCVLILLMFLVFSYICFMVASISCVLFLHAARIVEAVAGA
jgi:hypothetical protein